MSDIISPQLTQQNVKVWDLLVEINAPLEGKLDDWPPNVQDHIHECVEAKAKELELPLAIVDSCCFIDYGDTPGDDKYMLQVVVSEVVAKDIGFDKRLIDAKLQVMKMMETKH